MNKLGIYVHIPFCQNKCPYCDFYSLTQASQELKDKYCDALIRDFERYKDKNLSADTLYFGGGTPLLLGAERIKKLIFSAKDVFKIKHGEITIEINPGAARFEELKFLFDSGINRLSIGMQSASDIELKSIGRIHNNCDTQKCIKDAKLAGFENISLDFMLGIPHQTAQSICDTVKFIEKADVSHISAYMLKIEEGTPFFRNKSTLNIADDDKLADFYLLACKELEKIGFEQYEISNFSRTSHVSRHNMKYWIGADYLGFGASAHSCFGTRRFFYNRDIFSYIKGAQAVDDGGCYTEDEHIMLRLRLSHGITEKDYFKSFGKKIDKKYRERISPLCAQGLALSDEAGIRLTKEGFLLSNSIISYLLS